MRKAALAISRTAANIPGDMRQAERQGPHSEPFNIDRGKLHYVKALGFSAPSRVAKVKNRRMEFSFSMEQTQPRSLTYSF